MIDEKKYHNKFHKFQFKTDSEKDMELDAPPISKNLDTMKINDDFSNKLVLNYTNSDEGKDIDNEK